MSDLENDNRFELECLRLASDLKQLAKDTLNPDLKAHCLRMAKLWSGEADAPDNIGADKGPVH